MSDFGGINAHVVLEEHGRSAGSMRGSPPSRSAERQVPVDRRVSGGAHAPRVTGTRVGSPAERVFLAAAERPEDLLTQLDEASVLRGSALLDVPGGDDAGTPLRLAIADPTPKRLALARKVVARGSSWRGRNDVWFSPSGLLDAGGKVAFAFPGVEPTLAPELDDVAAHFGIGEPEAPMATDLGEHGMGTIRVGRLLAEALSRLGVEADVVVGHSLGCPTDRDGIRDVATRLYTEPVRFRELVENLYADGVRVFVQPGLGSVTGFVDDTLHGREHLTIAAAVPKRSGLAQLTRVAAALWVEGADVRFERLVAPTLTAVVRLDQPLVRGAFANANAAQGSLPGPTEVASTHPVPPTSVRAGAPARFGTTT